MYPIHLFNNHIYLLLYTRHYVRDEIVTPQIIVIIFLTAKFCAKRLCSISFNPHLTTTPKGEDCVPHFIHIKLRFRKNKTFAQENFGQR
jgi:hypothetical protein